MCLTPCHTFLPNENQSVGEASTTVAYNPEKGPVRITSICFYVSRQDFYKTVIHCEKAYQLHLDNAYLLLLHDHKPYPIEAGLSLLTTAKTMDWRTHHGRPTALPGMERLNRKQIYDIVLQLFQQAQVNQVELSRRCKKRLLRCKKRLLPCSRTAG